MSKSTYVVDLEARLHELDRKIEDATAALDAGTSAEKAHGLSDLAHLRHRHKDLVQRIEEAKALGADDWNAFHTSFQKDIDALVDTLDRWLTRTD
jgi:hypothetical protein